VKGEFGAASAVEIVSQDGTLLGKGLTGMSAGAIRSAAGQHTSVAGGEVVHRDDLVVLA